MKVGRKLLYDATKLDEIVDSVKRAKGSLGQIADINGITRENIHYWIKRGDEDRNNGLSTELAQFSHKLREAQGKVVIELCEMALHDEKKCRFIMWWLSKICREDFGIEGMEIKELRDIFKVILPLIGKGDAIASLASNGEDHGEA